MSLQNICSCDWDSPTFYAVEVRRSKKVRKCEECSGTIAVGERYEYARGKSDGYMFSAQTCERCCDILTWLKNSIPCFCYAHGGAFEDVEELLHEARRIAPDEAAGLWFGFHRRIILRDRHNRKARAQ